MKYVTILFAMVATVLFLSCSNKNINPVSASQNNLAKQKTTTSLQKKSSMNFRAHLNGATMLPPNNSKGQGEAIFNVSQDGNSIHYKLIVSNIENVFMAHIHVGGSATQKGNIAVWLYGNPSDPPSGLIPGRHDGILAEGTITASDLTGPLAGETIPDLVTEMENGDTYVIVHTTQNKPGEIRGHIH